MDFDEAQVKVKDLNKSPGNDKLLELYAFYKQGTTGDVTGKRPGMLDLKGRAKHDAWGVRKGMSPDDAKTAYVELVEKLVRDIAVEDRSAAFNAGRGLWKDRDDLPDFDALRKEWDQRMSGECDG